jgi:hypothetical protein
VQYLLAASAVLAVVFPYKYTFSEVSSTDPEPRIHTDSSGRSSGPFPSGSNQSLFSPSCSCYNGLAKQRQSQRTIYSHLARIGLCTSPTGSIATSSTYRASTTPLQSLQALSKRFCTRISSTSTIQSKSVQLYPISSDTKLCQGRSRQEVQPPCVKLSIFTHLSGIASCFSSAIYRLSHTSCTIE